MVQKQTHPYCPALCGLSKHHSSCSSLASCACAVDCLAGLYVWPALSRGSALNKAGPGSCGVTDLKEIKEHRREIVVFLRSNIAAG